MMHAMVLFAYCYVSICVRVCGLWCVGFAASVVLVVKALEP